MVDAPPGNTHARPEVGTVELRVASPAEVLREVDPPAFGRFIAHQQARRRAGRCLAMHVHQFALDAFELDQVRPGGRLHVHVKPARRNLPVAALVDQAVQLARHGQEPAPAQWRERRMQGTDPQRALIGEHAVVARVFVHGQQARRSVKRDAALARPTGHQLAARGEPGIDVKARRLRIELVEAARPAKHFP